jgi:hypothetical protein
VHCGRTNCGAARHPKEIIILEKLPLTDIGKPMKPALWRDIVDMGSKADQFRRLLAQLHGILPPLQRKSMCKFRPMAHPTSRSPFWKATNRAWASGSSDTVCMSTPTRRDSLNGFASDDVGTRL